MKATVAVLCAIASAQQNSEGGFIWKEKATVENVEGKSELKADEFKELIEKIKAAAQPFFAENEKKFPEAAQEFVNSAEKLIPADKTLNDEQLKEVHETIDPLLSDLWQEHIIEQIFEKAFGEFFPDGILSQEVQKRITDFKNEVKEVVKQRIQKIRETQPITQEKEQEITQQVEQLVKKKIETETAQEEKKQFREAEVKEHGKLPSQLVVSS